MTIIEHLRELRQRIVRSVLAIVVMSLIGMWLSEHMLGWLNAYYRDALNDESVRLKNFAPLEGFAVKLRLAAYFGLFGSSPVWLWQLWRFITPGLKDKEKRYAVPFLVSSVTLFLSGAAMGLFTLPAALGFLVRIAGKNQEALWSTNSFLYFVTLVAVAFGFSFLFPVVLVFLELVNLVTPRQLLHGWRYAIVAIFVIAAVITPSQDPITLLAMAGPMVILYFGSIAVGKFALKK